MKKPVQELLDLKQKVTKTLLDKGFELETFSIEIEEDANHIAHLRIKILPDTLKDEKDLMIESEFNNIIEGLE